MAVASARTAFGLDPTAWATRQDVVVEAPGLVKLALPVATLDAARANLADLRVLDPAGKEVPYLAKVAAEETSPTTRAPESFRGTLMDQTTQLLLITGTSLPLKAVTLMTPSPAFLKSARVEISQDGQNFTELRSGVPLFRQFGAEQLQIELNRQPAAQVRITIDDSRSRPVPFTGGILIVTANTTPAASEPLTAAGVVREEFAGHTEIRLDLGGRHVPLDRIELSPRDPVFTRKVTIGVTEITDGKALQRVLATGTVFRLAVEGTTPTSHLTVPAGFTANTRELTVSIENGDSPPLDLSEISLFQRPVWVIFSASASGRYTLLSGNPDAVPPRYDLSTFAGSLASAATRPALIGKLGATPGFHRQVPLADTALLGGALDVASWRFHKAVQLKVSGVQEIDLDEDVIAGAEFDLRDLRLISGGRQVPYIVQRPGNRLAEVAVAIDDDPRQPRSSRWQIALPKAHLPVQQVTLTSPTPLFRRSLRLYEEVAGPSGAKERRELADAAWEQSPGQPHRCTLNLTAPPETAALFLETDNGDNPAISLPRRIEVAYPTARIVFKADAAPLALHYGNGMASAPQYDISLVADQLLSAEKNTATLGPEQESPKSRWSGIATLRAGYIFWGALALVVVGLLVVVAKLLPKSPPPAV